MSSKLKFEDGPSWVVNARDSYTPLVATTYTQTNFNRGTTSIEVLDRVLEKSPILANVLIVGLGLADDPVLGSYVPHRVAGHMQGKGVDYQMTLVDSCHEVIDDVATRERLFLRLDPKKPNLCKAWRKYLEDTNQIEETVHEQTPGLTFHPNLDPGMGSWSAQYYLEDGIASSPVSPVFRKKLETGEIQLVTNDIAVADLGNDPFDFVDMRNVFYLIPSNGQKLAMANISGSLKLGGLCLVDDTGSNNNRPVFSRNGGWLDKEKMVQLGLEVDHIINGDGLRLTAVLRKTR